MNEIFATYDEAESHAIFTYGYESDAFEIIEVENSYQILLKGTARRHEKFAAALADWEAELNAHIEDFNKQYAIVLNGTKTLVMKTSFDENRHRKRRDYLSIQSFNALYANTKIKVGEKEVKGEIVDILKTKSQAWLEHANRKQYIDGIIFKPSIYAGGIEQKPMLYGNKLNLWEGYSVAPQKAEKELLNRIYLHIYQVVCQCDIDCYEYLLNWIARCLQYPEQTGQVAVALKGEKGCGKGTLGNFIKAIFGQHGLQVTNPKHLTGNFNHHMADCCFLFADEVFFAGDKTVENIMKGLITEPTLMIEAKGIDAIENPNLLKILMASNNDWITPASRDERRYFVLNVSSEKISDKAYFAALRADVNNPQIQAGFLFEMLHRDISHFDVSKVPDTAALKEQRAQSLDSFGKYWVDVLHRGYIYESHFNNNQLNQWITEPATDLIRAGYEQWCEKNKISQFNIISATAMGRRLSDWYKKDRRNAPMIKGEGAKGDALQTGNRPNIYCLGNQVDAILSFCTTERLDADSLFSGCL